jgi:hypothetical protein
MFHWRLVGAALAAACLLAAAARADEPKKDKDKARTDPPGAPVEAVLTAKKTTYQLDLGGKNAADFKKSIEYGDTTGEYPEAPAVDLVLELRNTGDKDIQIKVGGTMNVIDLDLQGPGAVSAELKRRITPKLIVASKTITLAPGKSEEVPITSLAYGFKGGYRAWWTEAGKYTLSASYKTSVSPVPAGAKDNGDGFADVKVISAPTTITVEAK